jgi:hypothetical protein
MRLAKLPAIHPIIPVAVPGSSEFTHWLMLRLYTVLNPQPNWEKPKNNAVFACKSEAG